MVEQFSFADGSVYRRTAIRAKVLVPTAGDDELYGYLGGEALKGLAGDDTINGGAGNDTLSGGAGMDSLTGGSGADRFVFDTAWSETNVYMVVSDFVSGTDLIGLSTEVFAGLGAVDACWPERLPALRAARVSSTKSTVPAVMTRGFCRSRYDRASCHVGMDFMITAAIA